MSLTQSRLKELLDYNPDTGVFVWRESRRGTVLKGSVAGHRHSNGYTEIKVDGVIYMAHRLVWLFVHGYIPPREVDHINRVRDDNKISNLRLAHSFENSQNRNRQKNSTSKVAGVCWCKDNKMWRARISVNNKRVHLGRFPSLEEAKAARAAAKKELHKFNPVDPI
jgi:hypothetical protein